MNRILIYYTPTLRFRKITNIRFSEEVFKTYFFKDLQPFHIERYFFQKKAGKFLIEYRLLFFTLLCF